uniref:Zn(2)-C6 fungal-type domain-containing protein n=1 Tax=Bionectria ochroleuca TaxID=29856 RepID=A0A8H7K4E6_BIOOC
MSKRPRLDNDENLSAAVCDQCRQRKVRCDRQQPTCSNCSKTGVECSSSNSTKRVNQTKELRGDLSAVLTQINHLDQSLGALTSLTRQIAADVAKPKSTQPETSPYFDSVRTNHPDGQTPDGQSQDIKHPLETVEFDRGGEYLYSYPAPVVLMKCLLHQATASLLTDNEHRANRYFANEGLCNYFDTLQDKKARDALQQKLDAFPFKSPCVDFSLAKDREPITSPPRFIANASVDGYLRVFNTKVPIFDENDLRCAINTHYSTESATQNNLAWPLITNAIVLLQLGLELRVAHASQNNSLIMQDAILFPFLENCDRAMRNLASFTVPTIVNVEALIILTLVSREFFSNATAERVCQAACQVGRALGLHRSKARRRSGSATRPTEDEKERERLFWVLYTLDKQRVFMTGQPCDLYSFDSDHDLQGPSLEDASNHMMTLWEEIHINLYSSKAADPRSQKGYQQIRHMNALMNEFSQRHANHKLNYSNNSESLNPLQAEFTYGCHVSELLVLSSEPTSEQVQIHKIQVCRSALKLILQVSARKPTPAQLATLARMFRNYPIVAFIELIAFHLWHLFARKKYNEDAQSDVSLLRAVLDRLQLLQLRGLSYTFYSRMKVGLSWALDTLHATGGIFGASLEPQAITGSDQNEVYSRPSRSTTDTNSSHPSPFGTANPCDLNQQEISPSFYNLNPGETSRQRGVSEQGSHLSQHCPPTHPSPLPSFSAGPPQPKGPCAHLTNRFEWNEWSDLGQDLEEFLARDHQPIPK